MRRTGSSELLPRGNIALTTRSSKYSTLRAIVLQWSRSRKRYERQGILVEQAALERAEEDCLSDAARREAQRVRAAQYRKTRDQEFISDFARLVRERYPGCPERLELEIAEHACLKYSGRVGRSAMARNLDPEAVDLAVRAHVRHLRTEYDTLLMTGGIVTTPAPAWPKRSPRSWTGGRPGCLNPTPQPNFDTLTQRPWAKNQPA